MNFLSIERFVNTSYYYYLNYKYSNGATKSYLSMHFLGETDHKRTRHSDLSLKTGLILKLQTV